MVVLGNDCKMSAADQPADAIHVDEIDHFNDDWSPPFAFRDGVKIRTEQKLSDFYTVYEEIGEGKFGKVFRCVEKETGLTLAAKFIKLRKDADLAKVEKEVQIMTKMRHKCIAQIYDAFAGANNDVILIMEIVAGGELFDRVIEEYYVLTETAVALIMYQICEALAYIHSQNIIHLDLKPENIMCVSQSGNQVKLIDFGLAQYYDGSHDLLLMAGTPEFAAPEVIKYEPLDFHTDMWSVGVIAYILLSGESPFLGDNIAETYCNVEKGKYVFCEQFDENGISEEARDFIRKLLVMNKSERMLPHQCLQHSWIVKSLERSKEMSRRQSQQELEKRLNTQKLKSYVRKKQFRKAVFTVLFVNQAMRLMHTLKERRSEAGVKYVQNMLNAVQNQQEQDKKEISSLLKSSFKRKPTPVGENAPPKKEEDVVMKPTTSQETVGKLSVMDVDRSDSDHKDTLQISVVSTDNESSRPSSPKPAKRHREKGDKPKRVKSTSRKASSSEQAAKKPKQGSLGTGMATMLLKPPETTEPASVDVDMKSRSPSPKSPILERKLPKTVEEKAADVNKVAEIKVQGLEKKDEAKDVAKDGAKSKKESLLARLPFKEEVSSTKFELPIASAAVAKKEETKVAGNSTINKKEEPTVVAVPVTAVATKKEEAKDQTSTTKPFSLPVAAAAIKKDDFKPFSLPVAAAAPATKIEAKQPLSASKSTPLPTETTVKKPLSKTISAKDAESEGKSPKPKKKRVKPKETAVSSEATISTAKLDLKPAENRPENKLFESKSLLKPVELQKPKDEAKCKSEEPSGSKVGNLLKQLQKNQTSDAPMMMAVSSFVPVKVEPAKVLKIEEEKGEIKKDPAKVLSPELVSKTVSEKKVSVRKKKVHKTKEAGEPNKTEVESIKNESSEVKVQHKINVHSQQDTSHTGIATKKLVFNEKDKTLVNKSAVLTEQEKVIDSRDELELIRQRLRQGKERKEQIFVEKSEQTTAKLEIHSENGDLKSAKGFGEKKKVLKAKVKEDNHVEEVKVSGGEKLYALLGQKSAQNIPQPSVKPEVNGVKPSFSEQLAATLEAKKRQKEQQAASQSKRGSRSTFEFDENDDSLLRQQQDAFDFSLLKAKLEQRLAGNASDSMDEQAYLDNMQQKQEAIKSLRSRLTDTGNVQRAKKKWLSMEKSLYDEPI